MGNGFTTALGDALSCLRTHEAQQPVARGVAAGGGADIDDAVLAATSHQIGLEMLLSQTLRLSFNCMKLPNLDTFSRTDGMAVLYEKRQNPGS